MIRSAEVTPPPVEPVPGAEAAPSQSAPLDQSEEVFSETEEELKYLALRQEISDRINSLGPCDFEPVTDVESSSEYESAAEELEQSEVEPNLEGESESEPYSPSESVMSDFEGEPSRDVEVEE